jgi:hypothetical protein
MRYFSLTKLQFFCIIAGEKNSRILVKAVLDFNFFMFSVIIVEIPQIKMQKLVFLTGLAYLT